MKMDLSKTKDYELLPIQWYHCIIKQAELIDEQHELYKEGNKPYVKVLFVIRSGDYKGRTFSELVSWTEKAIWAMKPLLLAMNYAQNKPIDVNPSEWVGEELAIKVKSEGKYSKPAMYARLEDRGWEPLGEMNEDIPF